MPNDRSMYAAWTAMMLVLLAVYGCEPSEREPSSDTTTAPVPSTQSVPPIAWEDIQLIIQNRCVTCHAEPDPADGIDLTLPGVVRRETLEGHLIDRLHDPEDPMPPKGTLNPEFIEMFTQWAAEGAVTDTNRSKTRLTLRDFQSQPNTGARMSVIPYNIDTNGFEFLERMQGHWIGSMELMGQSMPWFEFDYRAIGPAHVHGIFEGGTMGNLMTSFFFAKYKGVNTLMARNGGVLNGIYRMSYFVLDRVDQEGETSTYRFVDAIGGEDIMWMSLAFTDDQLIFEAHTSRMGEDAPPSRHMRFDARRHATKHANSAAEAHGFPQRVPLVDWYNGVPTPDWGSYGEVSSASYLWIDRSLSTEQMGVLAGDPIRIEHLSTLAQVTLVIERDNESRNAKLLVYFSSSPFTDRKGQLIQEYGYITERVFNSTLLFSEFSKQTDEFTFTYLHPGPYFLTVVADLDGDGIPGTKDRIIPSRSINLEPGDHSKLRLSF